MYDQFQQLNGQHSWRDVSPDGYVDYQVRYRPGGRVLYFNFNLARELELIPANHAHRMNPQLEKVILDTFALRIINEYDLAHQNQMSSQGVRPNSYMATRYLQAQHKDKRGI